MNSHSKGLGERISRKFKNKNLFTQALTHSSYANGHHLDHSRCNERLESLGDAALEVVTSEFPYRKYETLPEGDLTKIRVDIVYEPALAYCTEDIELSQYLYLDKGEDAIGGRNRNSVMSDTAEALISAIYPGGGFASAEEFIHRFILNDTKHEQLFYNSKTILQEIVRSHQEVPLSYEIIREEDPDHSKSLGICVKMGDEEVGRDTGYTKKATEQVAACNDTLKLKAQGAAAEE